MGEGFIFVNKNEKADCEDKLYMFSEDYIINAFESVINKMNWNRDDKIKAIGENGNCLTYHMGKLEYSNVHYNLNETPFSEKLVKDNYEKFIFIPRQKIMPKELKNKKCVYDGFLNKYY